jgi:hypothetical protein
MSVVDFLIEYSEAMEQAQEERTKAEQARAQMSAKFKKGRKYGR